jgi:chromosome segregation ATPase
MLLGTKYIRTMGPQEAETTQQIIYATLMKSLNEWGPEDLAITPQVNKYAAARPIPGNLYKKIYFKMRADYKSEIQTAKHINQSHIDSDDAAAQLAGEQKANERLRATNEKLDQQYKNAQKKAKKIAEDLRAAQEKAAAAEKAAQEAVKKATSQEEKLKAAQEAYAQAHAQEKILEETIAQLKEELELNQAYIDRLRDEKNLLQDLYKKANSSLEKILENLRGALDVYKDKKDIPELITRINEIIRETAQTFKQNANTQSAAEKKRSAASGHAAAK